jgi:hypothetical protein
MLQIDLIACILLSKTDKFIKINRPEKRRENKMSTPVGFNSTLTPFQQVAQALTSLFFP